MLEGSPNSNFEFPDFVAPSFLKIASQKIDYLAAVFLNGSEITVFSLERCP